MRERKRLVQSAEKPTIRSEANASDGPHDFTSSQHTRPATNTSSQSHLKHHDPVIMSHSAELPGHRASRSRSIDYLQALERYGISGGSFRERDHVMLQYFCPRHVGPPPRLKFSTKQKMDIWWTRICRKVEEWREALDSLVKKK